MTKIRDYKSESAERRKRFIGFELDNILMPKVDARIKELGISKGEYVRQLLLKDLGLKLVPTHYEEVKNE